MRKFNIYSLLAILSMMILGSSCSKDEIVFDHELPQFETRAGAYLLEVIMPQGTGANDDIYIVGAFNGGDSATVVNDMTWKLEKCQANDIKWGIYLTPESFAQGTSLADGYTFLNMQQGWERSLQGQPVTHTEVPALGGRINVTVDRWQSYFDTPADPGEIEHDGYAIYVEDKTTWASMYCYAWGDGLPELFGGWPGVTPTGTVTIGDVKYKYWDTGKANEGLTYNFILNNNEGTQYEGGDLAGLILDKDYYFKATDEGVEAVGPAVSHDGYAIFCINATGWDEITMYAWGDGLENLYGDWPGVAPTGTQVINGVEYTYWDTGKANEGLHYNFIANNNNGGKQIENNDILGVDLTSDHYFILNADLTVAVVDPADPPVVGPVEPDPDPVTHPYTIYVKNTLNWDENYIYAYGDKEMFGAWPGLKCEKTQTIGGVEFLVFPYEGAGESLTLIINNNAGQQVDGLTVKADKDLFFEVNENGWTEINCPEGNYKLYIEDQTGWAGLYCYAWGDVEMFGGWPGVAANDKETVDGVEYKVIPYTGAGQALNLIFNNNDGSQTADLPIKAFQDYYITVTADGASIKQ